MKGILRAIQRTEPRFSWLPLVCIAVIGVLFLVIDAYRIAQPGDTIGEGDVFRYTLLAILIAAFIGWTLLAALRKVQPASASGFCVATLGVVLLWGSWAIGLAAYAVGFALVVWACWRDLRAT